MANNNSSTKKFKHLTLDDRIEIQECLSKGLCFKAIARRIDKDPTTVSREVKLHCKAHINGFVSSDSTCPKLLKAPFVCNGCKNRANAGCRLPRRLYVARDAQREYESTLSDSREGIPLTHEEFYKTERIISDAVKAGQHIYQVLHTAKLPVASSTVYRHINKGYYSISRIDLPRAVKFKPRKSHATDYVPKGIKVSRSYQDFLAFRAEHPSLPVTEMDTVIGRIGGKVIMTFQLVEFSFMFGLLLDNKSAPEAAAKIRDFKALLLQNRIVFGDLFPLILTDNGGEFSDVFAFENNASGEKESSLFFCDPNAPYQKPHVENNHSLFRCIVPSGTSFDSFSQQNVNLIFSHVNAVKRSRFNGKSPYDLFSFAYSPDIAALLGISFVPPSEVIQTPKLLKSLSK